MDAHEEVEEEELGYNGRMVRLGVLSTPDAFTDLLAINAALFAIELQWMEHHTTSDPQPNIAPEARDIIRRSVESAKAKINRDANSFGPAGDPDSELLKSLAHTIIAANDFVFNHPAVGMAAVLYEIERHFFINENISDLYVDFNEANTMIPVNIKNTSIATKRRLDRALSHRSL